MATLGKLFEDHVKDVYYAERKIAQTLPKMAKKCQSAELRAAFEKHLEETEAQIERLEQVFELLGKPARGKRCPAIDGILEEGSELMQEEDVGPALDAGMAAGAQAVEHYEIARYGTLIAWATELGHSDAAALLSTTLDEEEATDEALSELATTQLNPAANQSETTDPENAEMKAARPAGKPAAKLLRTARAFAICL